MTTFHESLRELLAAKTSELFADYGVPCAPLDVPPDGERQLCGVLGFTGDRMCGSVVIAASHDAVAASNPIGDGATRGWVAELTNQLVGRFKNALLRHGIEIAMSIPVVLTATQLMPLPHTRIEPTRMAVGPGFLTIWLEIEADPDLELGEQNSDSMIAAEGEALLF